MASTGLRLYQKTFLAIIIVIGLLGVVLGPEFALFCRDAALHNNFHEVTPGEFYRSAQMPYGRIEEVIKQYRIKTVIDIRAGGDKFGTEENSEQITVTRLGADYLPAPIIGSRLPSRETILHLIDIFDSAKLPILLHDTSGTHRAGTASAIWVLAHKKQGLEAAKSQLVPRYGFLRWERALKTYLQGHETIDFVIWNYEKASSADPQLSFRDWVTKELPADG